MHAGFCRQKKCEMKRIVLGLTLAALSAVLFTLAFPPYDLWPLIFVGLAEGIAIYGLIISFMVLNR